MKIKNVTVIGGGVLGSQIGYQAAFRGYKVTFWGRSEGSLKRTEGLVKKLAGTYQETLEGMRLLCGSDGHSPARAIVAELEDLTEEKIEELKERAGTIAEVEWLKGGKKGEAAISLTEDLAEAVKGADLVIEAVAENVEVKNGIYRKLAEVMEPKTILATNSSTLLPSMFAEATGRPEKYLALHFANSIWKNNTAEVMGHTETSEVAYNAVVEFAEGIGMVPLCLKKEQPGYILNSLLVPLLDSAEKLLVGEVADVQTIDRTWMLATGAPVGPFRILDIVGLKTAYNVVMMRMAGGEGSAEDAKVAEMLRGMIEEGKLGIETGEGFYKYGGEK